MANRFPLIFNSGAGQIQELAVSDNLDLTSSNLVNAGILFTSSGSATAPSLQIGSGTTYNPGLYSPGTDQLAISTNGVERVEFGTAEVVFNDGGENYDFRIESDTEANLFFVDASTDRVGVGTSAPGTNLDVNGTVRMRIAGGGTDRYVDIGSDGSGTTRFFNNYTSGGDFGFIWTIGASDRMTLDTSGRLLVGTTTYAGNGKLITAGNTGGDAGTFDICWTGSRPTAANTDIGYIRWYSADNSAGNAHYASIYASSDGASSSGSDIPGRLVFSTTADGGSSPTEAMRINSQQELLVGTATRTANGGILQLSSGITFPATAVAASDANTLDDYEEGTWTPVATSQTGSITAYTSSATYTKTGNVVCVLGTIGITTAGTAAGVLLIAGYPFTASSQGSLALAAETNLTAVAYQVRITASTTTGFIAALAGSGAIYTNGGSYSFALTYLT